MSLSAIQYIISGIIKKIFDKEEQGSLHNMMQLVLVIGCSQCGVILCVGDSVCHFMAEGSCYYYHTVGGGWWVDPIYMYMHVHVHVHVHVCKCIRYGLLCLPDNVCGFSLKCPAAVLKTCS